MRLDEGDSIIGSLADADAGRRRFTSRDLDELTCREVEAESRVREIEKGDDASKRHNLDRERGVLSRIRFQKYVVLGAIDAKFPSDVEIADANLNREQCRYWMPKDRPVSIPSEYERSSCPIFSTHMEHSVTTDYERDRWGVRNILLETLQNAEPNDSGGTWFNVEFFARGQWRAYSEINKFKNPEISAVRVVDNGGGYAPTELKIMGSSKSPDGESGGLFGEGGKMADVTACTLGIDVMKSSRNWRAKPSLSSEIATDRVVKQLAYDVDFFEDTLQGSAVEFRSFSDDFLDEFRSIDQYYLPLRGSENKTLSHTHPGDIVDVSDRNVVFIKGRAYPLIPEPKKPFLFTYNLRTFQVKDRNRSRVNLSEAEEIIDKIWYFNRSKEAIRALIIAHKEGKDAWELTLFGKDKDLLMGDEVAALFAETICEVYGIEDPEKTFSAMPEGYDDAERFLRDSAGFQSLPVGRSPFLRNMLQRHFRSTQSIFSKSQVNGLPGAMFSIHDCDIMCTGTDIFVDGQVHRAEPAFRHPPLFSYNIHCIFHALDGKRYPKSGIELAVMNAWRSVTSEAVVRALFQAYIGKIETFELNEIWVSENLGISVNTETAKLFEKVAVEIFGVQDPKKYFVKTDDKEPTAAEAMLLGKGYTVINLNRSKFLAALCLSSGMPTSEKVLERMTYEVPFDYSVARLDVKSDHQLFVDLWRFSADLAESRADRNFEVCIRPKGKKNENVQGEWMPYREWLRKSSGVGVITGARFVIDGKILSPRDDLQYVNPGRDNRPCLHAMMSYLHCNGADASIESGSELIRIEGHRYLVQDTNFDGDADVPQRVVISIFKLSDEMEGAIRDLKSMVIEFDPGYKPLESTPYGDFVGDGGVLYLGGVATPIKDRTIMCSYAVDNDDVDAPARVISALKTVDAIAFFLKEAAGELTESGMLDIVKLGKVDYPNVWKEAFYEAFGDKAVVDDAEDALGLAVLDKYGYTRKTLHPAIRRVLLEQAGVTSVSDLAVPHECEVVDDPPPHVKLLLSFWPNVCAWLVEEGKVAQKIAGKMTWDPRKIKVVKKIANKNGDSLADFGGAVNPITGECFVCEKQLQKLPDSLIAMMRILYFGVSTEFKNRTDMDASRERNTSKVYERFLHTEVLRMATGRPLYSLSGGELYGALQILFGDAMSVDEAERNREECEKNRFWNARRALWQTQRAIRDQIVGVFRNIKNAMLERKLKKMTNTGRPVVDTTTLVRVSLVVAGIGAVAYGGNMVYSSMRSGSSGGGSSSDSRRVGGGFLDGFSGLLPSFDMPDIIPDIDFSGFEKLLGDKKIGYRRPSYSSSYMPSVTARRQASGITSEMNDPEWMDTVFVSYPNFDQWDGFWMSDFEYHRFDGTNWSHDTNPPQFPEQNYESQIPWFHVQAMISPGDAFIRTQSSGRVDISSIQVLDKDDRPVKFKIRPEENGFVVSVDSDQATQVTYATLIPANWGSDASAVTDADYEKLPREVYNYYTKTPDIDMSKIPFSWKQFPQFKTLAKFFDFLKKNYQPYDRMTIWHDYVQSREYSDDPDTARAYGDFRAGNAPEKTLIEFLLRSHRLPSVGAGDCDVHNTLNAWGMRVLGIPAKMDTVMDGEHGIVNAFIPGVGWIVSDAVGERWGGGRTGGVRAPRTTGIMTPAEADKYRRELLRRRECNVEMNECLSGD